MNFNHRLDLQKGGSWGELDLDLGEHQSDDSHNQRQTAGQVIVHALTHLNVT